MAFLTGNSFDPNKNILDLSGKTYLVTGGSAGIGFGICAHLVQHKAKVLLLSNKEEHTQDAIEDQIEWVQCDLSTLKDTDRAAKEIVDRKINLAGLMLTAGLGVGKHWKTADGLECHFQVNWLIRIHLALRLIPILHKPGGRLVFMSSDLHRGADVGTQINDIQEINTDFDPTKLYNPSKLALVLGMLAIQRRMQNGDNTQVKAVASDKIYVNATHPGAVSTDQQEQAVEAYGLIGKIGVAATRPFMKDAVESGCRSALFALTSQEVEGQGITGGYIVPDKKVSDPSEKAQDVELSEQLWRLSHDLLEQKLGQ